MSIDSLQAPTASLLSCNLAVKIQPTYRTARQGHGPNRSPQRGTPKAEDLPLGQKQPNGSDQASS
jgi:hypothetical protein